MVHTEGLKDALAADRVEGVAPDKFDKAAKDHEAHVGIAPARTGRPIEGKGGVTGQHRIQAGRVFVVRLTRDQPGCVSQQMPDGDASERRHGNVVGDRLIQVQEPVVAKQ